MKIILNYFQFKSIMLVKKFHMYASYVIYFYNLKYKILVWSSSFSYIILLYFCYFSLFKIIYEVLQKTNENMNSIMYILVIFHVNKLHTNGG
jgi:hypothetical protein